MDGTWVCLFKKLKSIWMSYTQRFAFNQSMKRLLQTSPVHHQTHFSMIWMGLLQIFKLLNSNKFGLIHLIA